MHGNMNVNIWSLNRNWVDENTTGGLTLLEPKIRFDVQGLPWPTRSQNRSSGKGLPSIEKYAWTVQ